MKTPGQFSAKLNSLTDIIMPMAVQTDFDLTLAPQFRVAVDGTAGGGVQVGAPVVGIRTTQGNVRTRQDVFIPAADRLMPFEVMYPAVAVKQDGLKPASVTAAAPANDVQSKFLLSQAGTYYYLVSGVNQKGQSTGRVSAAVAIGSGQKAVLTIAGSPGGEETGYVIYRSRLGGTTAPNDFRIVTKIPKAGATTTWTDLNRKIPGTTRAYGLDMRTGQGAIDWRQLLPMTKFPLYPTVSAVRPWAQLLFGYLRMTKRRHHIVWDNILPNNSAWKPFG